MTLIIDGKAAVLQEKFSFDYVTENPSFSDAEAYTLKITLPMKDCPQNLAIFGHINRKDIRSQDLIYDCEIQDGKFHKEGAVTILSINDKEVQVQFLEGKSIANCSETLDDIIINQLDLGYPNTAKSATNYRHWATEDISTGRNYMALPWVNNNSGNIQNDSSGSGWSEANERLSFQPYLIYITKLIFQAIGYTYNLYSWEQSQYKYLLLCNALPAAWGVENWARALPAWSVAEFIEQLELLMNARITVDTHRKNITFAFIHSGGVGNGYKVTKLVDEFAVDIVDPSECKYKGALNLKYASCDHEMWRYYDCPETIELVKEFETGGVKRYYEEVNTFNDLLSRWSHYSEYPDYKPYTSAGTQYMIYVRDIDTYFVIRLYKTYIQMINVPGFDEQQPSGTWDCYPMPVNQFAHTNEHPDADTKEIKIVPAWLDDLPDRKTQMIFLELPDYVGEGGQLHVATQEELCKAQPIATAMLRDGLPDKENDEFFDKMYVGFYRKEYVFQNTYPIPMLDRFQINLDWEYKTCPYSLRLHDPQNSNYEPMPEIDRTRKYTFKFLADTIPNVNSLFFIAGNRYLCSKLTVNFTKKGKSQLVKGEFWRVDDSFSHHSSW